MEENFLLDNDLECDIATLECSARMSGLLNTKPLKSTLLQESLSKEAFDTELLNSVLLEKTKELCQFIDIPTLLPVLKSRHLVTSDDFLELLKRWEQGLHRTTVGVLLEILPRKHPEWTLLLFESLRDEEEHAGHVYLAGLLKESAKKRLELQVATKKWP